MNLKKLLNMHNRERKLFTNDTIDLVLQSCDRVFLDGTFSQNALYLWK